MFRHAHTLSVPFRVFVQVVGKPQQAMKMETLFFVRKLQERKGKQTMDKRALAQKINALEGLSNDEKSALLDLLHERKKYGIVWEDKPEDVETQLNDELPVLTEVKERAIISDDADAPNHILIEGDNLHALTALSYTHAGKIDVIYIDPPYNTGNKDFIFNDSYVDKEDSYRHSKWLSFMSKRLEIAKGLLSDKGVIFISIDDNEQSNLKMLCDEVFGERNFLGQLIIKTATDNNATQINTEHEYMICYSKYYGLQSNWKRTSTGAKAIQKKYLELKKQYSENSDIQKELRLWIKANKSDLPQVAHYNNVDEKGVYSSSSNSSNPHPGGYDYDIFHPQTHLAVPKPANGWRWPPQTFQAYDVAGEIEWGIDHTTQPHVKKRLETATEYLRSMIYEDNRGTTMALAEMFDGHKVFDNPKSLKIISTILEFTSKPSSTILDFFAGSGTTLHATMELNKDGGHRQCILVTNNENNICEEVTYVRNQRVIQGYTKPNGETVEGLHSNNLRYYKTTFVLRAKTMANKRALTAAATDLLCIKNNVYQEIGEFGGVKLHPKVARYFDDGKTRMLVIYIEAAISKFVDLLLDMEVEGKILVYVFSNDNYAYDDDFEEVLDKVELCALPDAIYKAYKNVLPQNKTAEDVEGQNESEAANSSEEDAQ